MMKPLAVERARYELWARTVQSYAHPVNIVAALFSDEFVRFARLLFSHADHIRMRF